MNGTKGIVICNFCKKQVTQAVADKTQWDWFTGYLKETFHSCGRCKLTNIREFNARLERSRIKPATEGDKE